MLKANAVDIVAAVQQNQVAEVRLACQYAPEKVNDKDSVMLLMYMLILILLWLWDRMGPPLFRLLQRGLMLQQYLLSWGVRTTLNWHAKRHHTP